MFFWLQCRLGPVLITGNASNFCVDIESEISEGFNGPIEIKYKGLLQRASKYVVSEILYRHW